MATKTFATAALLQAATAALTPDQLATVSAGPAEGGIELTYPDNVADLIGASTPVPMLAATLLSAASGACAALTAQIVPDQVHQNAYINAAAIVGPAATVPTADPAKTAFANLAAANGAQPQAFATLVVEIAAASFQLSAALAALSAAAGQAKAPADLTAALQAFEAALAAIVSAITSSGIAVEAPKSITIAGLTA